MELVAPEPFLAFGTTFALHSMPIRLPRIRKEFYALP